MKHRYHLKPWELRWQKSLRNFKHSKVGLFLLRRIPESVLSKIPYEAIPLWIASVLTGVVSVFYEKLFTWFEESGEHFFEVHPATIFITAPVFIFGGWWLVQRFSPEAAGSGIPQLMAAVNSAGTRRRSVVDYLLNIRVILVKIGSSLLILLGGGAIGREGPTLQISGSIFQVVYRLIPESWPKVSHKIMLITGGASGLAAAFNTPLGGIVYVVEELTKSHIGKFRTAVFSAVIISGMTAQLFLGSYLYLGFPKVNPLPLLSILWVILFAFLSGVLGSLFSKTLLKIAEFRSLIRKPATKILIVLVFAFAFATLVYFTGKYTMGTGKPLINEILFGTKPMPWYMFPARFLGAVLTFAVGGAGGIFATSLSSGASLGTLLISIFSIAKEQHNILVLVSMIGFLTGVTKSPFTAAILVLEMTDRHSAIFYFLLAGLVANFGSSLIMDRSFYEIRKEDYLKSTLSKIKSPNP